MTKRLEALAAIMIAIALWGCQSQQRLPGGSLSDIKRDQERQLMYACIDKKSAIRIGDHERTVSPEALGSIAGEWGVLRGGGLTVDVIKSCRRYADSRVW